MRSIYPILTSRYSIELYGKWDPRDTQPARVSATTKLAAPAGLAANAPNAKEVNLSWQDRSSHEDGFIIKYRKTGHENNPWVVVYAPVNATGFPIVGLTPQTQYDFEIYAYRAAPGRYVESDKGTGTTASATTPAVPDPNDPPPPGTPAPPDPVLPVPQPNSITLIWDNGPGRFYNASGHTGTTLSVSGVPAGQPYRLEVDFEMDKTWDGSETTIPDQPNAPDNPIGPDYWRASGPGGTLVNDTFTVFDNFSQTYPERGSTHHFSWPLPAGTSTFSFEMNTTTSQGCDPVDDEGWTISAFVSFGGIPQMPAPIPDPPPPPPPPPPNPPTPSVWIAAQDAAGSESPDQGQSTPGPLKFMVGRSTTSGSLTVQLFAAAGTATASDYTGFPSSVSIPDGQYYSTFTVTPVDDAVYEGDESVYAIRKVS